MILLRFLSIFILATHVVSQWYRPLSFLRANIASSKDDDANGTNDYGENTEWIDNMLQLLPEERISLNHGTYALQHYEQKGDCFKEAASSLRHGCQGIRASEEERTRYAVRLTMCEIATANIPAPLECESDETISNCAEAMSKVPQLWTSYSGYFRQVESMCFAIRYAVERDLLEQLHRNITVNQLINYQILKKQQFDMINWRREEMTRLTEIEDSQRKIEGSVAAIENTTTNAKTKLTAINTTLASAHELLELLLSKHREAIESVGLSIRTTDAAQIGLQDVLTFVTEIGSEMLHLNQVIAATIASQSMMNIWVTDMENQLAQTFQQANATLVELAIWSNQEMENQNQDFSKQLAQAFQQTNATLVELVTRSNQDMENQYQNFSKQLAQAFQQTNATLVEFVTWSNQEIRLLGHRVTEVREDYEEVAGVFGSMVKVVRVLYDLKRFWWLVAILLLMLWIGTWWMQLFVVGGIIIVMVYSADDAWNPERVATVVTFFVATVLFWALHRIWAGRRRVRHNNQVFLNINDIQPIPGMVPVITWIPCPDDQVVPTISPFEPDPEHGRRPVNLIDPRPMV